MPTDIWRSRKNFDLHVHAIISFASPAQRRPFRLDSINRRRALPRLWNNSCISEVSTPTTRRHRESRPSIWRLVIGEMSDRSTPRCIPIDASVHVGNSNVPPAFVYLAHNLDPFPICMSGKLISKRYANWLAFALTLHPRSRGFSLRRVIIKAVCMQVIIWDTRYPALRPETSTRFNIANKIY